jgi:hypothetical protein
MTARVRVRGLRVEVLLRLRRQSEVGYAVIVALTINVVDLGIWPFSNAQIPSDMMGIELMVVHDDLAIADLDHNASLLPNGHAI